MRTRHALAAAATAAATVLLGVCAVPASAQDTDFTVSAGAAQEGRHVSFTFASPAMPFHSRFKNVETITCGGSRFVGSVLVGSNLPPGRIVRISGGSLRSQDCAFPQHPNLAFSVTGSGLWAIHGNCACSPDSVEYVTLSHIQMYFATTGDGGVACSFDIHGAGQFNYANSTQVLSPERGGPLQVQNVSGCSAISVADGTNWFMTALPEPNKDNAWSATATNNPAYDPLQITSVLATG